MLLRGCIFRRIHPGDPLAAFASLLSYSLATLCHLIRHVRACQRRAQSRARRQRAFQHLNHCRRRRPPSPIFSAAHVYAHHCHRVDCAVASSGLASGRGRRESIPPSSRLRVCTRTTAFVWIAPLPAAGSPAGEKDKRASPHLLGCACIRTPDRAATSAINTSPSTAGTPAPTAAAPHLLRVRVLASCSPECGRAGMMVFYSGVGAKI